MQRQDKTSDDIPLDLQHELYDAIEENNYKNTSLAIKQILKLVNPEAISFSFVRAVRHGKDKAALAFIDNKCDVNARNWEGNALLFIAASDTIFSALLAGGAVINVRNQYNQTPLVYYASLNNLARVKELLEKPDVELDLRDNSRKTAQAYALENDNQEIVKLIQKAREEKAKRWEQPTQEAINRYHGGMFTINRPASKSSINPSQLFIAPKPIP